MQLELVDSFKTQIKAYSPDFLILLCVYVTNVYKISIFFAPTIAIVGWEETMYTVTESSSVEICGVTSEVLSRTFTLLIHSQDGTAGIVLKKKRCYS